MRTLHILKSEPDDTVAKLINDLSGQEGATVMPIYQDNVDWARLVDDIFEHENVICWW